MTEQDVPADPQEPGDPADPGTPADPEETPGELRGAGAQAIHGVEDPVTAGNVWSAAAVSERPGDHAPPPDGWVNPPALELHGPTTPAEHPAWIPSDGGASGPYDLGRTEHAPPAGYVNPPAIELHGSGRPAA